MKGAIILLTSITITGILSCQDRLCMCLTWKVKNSSLVLTCKTTTLSMVVSLNDPLDKEQGFCAHPIPYTHCYPRLKNVRIHQNIKTNETIFYVAGPLDKRMNGNWTCRHGVNVESVTVEVTLPNSQERKTRSYCWQLLLLCTISGFVLFYILSQLFLYITFSPCTGSCSENSCLKTLGKKIWIGRRNMIERITDSCMCLQKNKEFSMKAIKRAFVCLLLVLMVAIPVAVGFSQKGMCSGNLGFIPIGFVFGFIVRMLLMDERGTEREKSFINGCCCLSCKGKEEEQTDPKEHDNFMDNEEDQTNTERQADIQMLNVPGTSTESDT
ncbi:uncharacterized protein LOC127703004 [Mytilus californianus]|uniref:uncharacterized protein LOC127703004 n=1 Tax=Mytilus californianus TaxID=6549 RepID=UPI00224641FC|nr:uncharacterized protein LOC127703004 [Mytilus californianus]XP_052063339.1 uncharacterized protein LOC127703004 [Mytilus californianus]